MREARANFWRMYFQVAVRCRGGVAADVVWPALAAVCEAVEAEAEAVMVAAAVVAASAVAVSIAAT